MTVTWALTARPAAFIPPDMGALSASLFGAGAGALGGLLLLAIDRIRRPAPPNHC
jgi:hypothetical protein